MRLKTLDQLHVSSVRADSLRPNEEFDVSDSTGEELLKRHPNTLRRVDSGSSEKAEQAPANKSEAPPANKAVGQTGSAAGQKLAAPTPPAPIGAISKKD